MKVAVTVGLLISHIAVGTSFEGLGDLPGGIFSSIARSMSNNGVVTGSSISGPEREAFIWTTQGGMQPLGSSNNYDIAGDVFAISGNGKFIVTSTGGPNGAEAVRWSNDSGFEGLGDFPSERFSSTARGVNFDGSVVVGQGDTGVFDGRAFRWTESTGLQNLGSLPGGGRSFANAVSANGDIVVGRSSSSEGNLAFRWTAETGMTSLGDLPGGIVNSHAYGISGNGTYIVGDSVSVGASTEAFLWDSVNGMRGLGDFAGGAFESRANDVSDDGVVVGVGIDQDNSQAFIYSDEIGLVNLKDLLESQGVAGVEDWLSLSEAVAISDDSTLIAGRGINSDGNAEAFIVSGFDIAQIPEANSTGVLVGFLSIAAAFLRRRRRS